ncbi:hypothetical protein OP10G_2978 [Fimbriimonas ginsengisoli Gsoil 348]|uniref:Uncharacterized protein n=1 Tax=Fimbriimonas ginsengisoli Gsoil 348 TaxID=661478 RepID=A0A068NSC7_FIMGI|nr:hypothetical protein OP10G_2978 [Fimbriimonas ginsengisoli Gsoil 348]
MATLVCNEVIEDKRSGNKTVVGIFNAIGAAQLPATHPRMSVMASVTNAEREIGVELILRGPEGKDMLNVDAQVPARGPGDVVDLLFELNNITFNEFGDYAFEVVYNGVVIGARKFLVIEHKPQ